MNKPTKPRRSTQPVDVLGSCPIHGDVIVDVAASVLSFTGRYERVLHANHAGCDVTKYLELDGEPHGKIIRELLSLGIGTEIVDEEMDDAARASTVPLSRCAPEFLRCLDYVDQLAGTAMRETQERA